MRERPSRPRVAHTLRRHTTRATGAHRAHAQLKMEEKLPAALPASFADDEPFLRALHHVLLEIEILEGSLVCPETGKKFPIKEGIPSML